MRSIKYFQAINEGLREAMARSTDVFQIGVGINTPWYVGQTMVGLLDAYGEERMIDTPVSENGVMGVAVGAALTGKRPIVTFPRMDFMYYAMDQICNHAAVLSYSFGGRISLPVTIRGIINRGGEQGAQHSQALQAVFAHIPGIRVVMPADAFDAKGMLIAAVEQNSPVLYIDDRWLYDFADEVPEGYYTSPLSGAKILNQGTDITIVATSYMVVEARKAVDVLAQDGISAELIDVRCIKPIDSETILRSVSRTGKIVIADGGWKTCGVAAEIAAIVACEGFSYIKAPISRVTLPDIHAPASRELERCYYPSSTDIITESLKLLKSRKP
jgi:pyruvate dehydrogenase E1 component beta subunit